MSAAPLAPVIDHLQEVSHPHLTPDLVRSKGTMVDSPEPRGPILFDVEYEKRAWGARYREGRPLAAVETYWVRYRYDPDRAELRRLGTNVGDEQASRVTVHSYARLLRDQVETFIGILSRGWP